jgi:hypothetical protein
VQYPADAEHYMLMMNPPRELNRLFTLDRAVR